MEEQFYLLWPFLVWLLPRRRLAAFAAIAGAVTFAGALLSWHLLEKRFLRWKDLVPHGRRPDAGSETFRGAPSARRVEPPRQPAFARGDDAG